MTKRIAILGSTGSIGTQTLDVVRQHPDRFSVFMISANSSAQRLVEQALAFHEVAESFPALRRPIDKLEELVDNKLWPLPKYRELLFIN